MATIKKINLFCILLLVLGLISCRQSELQTEAKLKVLTTIPPLYSFTKSITGDIADVDNLITSVAGPHEYSFSLSDAMKIKKAHVLIKNGVNLENWLGRLLSSAGNKTLKIIDTSSGVEIINNNPHIWLSPGNAVVQVRNILNALIEADPENSKRYIENAGNYIERLEILDRQIKSKVKTFREINFVAFHSAFLYFARDYGLKQVAVIQEFPEKNLSPKHIADVINKIKASGTKIIFSEPGINNRIVETLARDLNLHIYRLDTLETGELLPQWYEDRIMANLEVIEKAFKDSEQ